MRRFTTDRDTLAELFGHAMQGNPPPKSGLPFGYGKGQVKTYAIEVNGAASVDRALERLGRLASDNKMRLGLTADSALAVMWRGDDVGLFVDVLDPRFWLLHTASPAASVWPLLRRAVWSSRDVDWCWFPLDLLRRLQADGEARWFNADFRGQDLLPTGTAGTRRLRVRLEADDAVALFEALMQADPRYRHAAALTSVATGLQDPELGRLVELAHYQGQFVTRGDSFEMHVGFVTRALRRYRELVERVEKRFRFTWGGTEASGLSFSGEVITLPMGRRVPDFGQFLTGLFSCREPFRLWAVPRIVGDDFAEAEVVDLHIGERFRMEITPDLIRLILPSHTCGNSVLRLVTNLQHRYDATLSPEFLRT